MIAKVLIHATSVENEPAVQHNYTVIIGAEAGSLTHFWKSSGFW